jgi:GH15 family glucan-1,4-alpha-glucosidase
MGNYVRVWADMRQKIRRDILKKGWDADVQAFVQAYGEKDLDAANLLMEHYGFIAADDPRYMSTVIETHKQLGQNGLMYRYRNHDDFGTPKSSFTVCTFWMVKSLYKIGRRKEAQSLFHKILCYRNHVGLLSEDIDFESKRLLGNFPQGYSHLALIDAAITLTGEDITEPIWTW